MRAKGVVSYATAVLLSNTAATRDVALRYMPLGDSITEVSCWRPKLWQMLQTTEWADVDWVGSSQLDNFCGDTAYDRDSEGHSGYLAVGIANLRLLPAWLQANPADVVTMHLGINDLCHGQQVPDIIAAFTVLVEDMRKSNPRMKIIVAQIIPMAFDAFGVIQSRIQSLNSAIVPWAQGLNNTASPIWVVDQYTGFSNTADLRDGIHPNDAGDRKMASVWYPALVNAFRAAREDKLLDACQICWSANALSGQKHLV